MSLRSAAVLDAHVVKHRAAFTVDVALSVPDGWAVALFGASGTGKSTVLSCVAGLEEPDGGHVSVNGRQLFPPSVPMYRRQVGYMTQNADLFPHLTVGQNVLFSENERNGERDWTAELVARLGLGEFWTVPAARISGGQARRVAIARMLVRRPACVLLDEPFTALDRHVVRALTADILKWQADLGFSLVVVDHNVDVLERLCPRAIVLENGRAVQAGTWNELRSAPATALLAQLLEPL